MLGEITEYKVGAPLYLLYQSRPPICRKFPIFFFEIENFFRFCLIIKHVKKVSYNKKFSELKQIFIKYFHITNDV